jgi:hypothetical protein
MHLHRVDMIGGGIAVVMVLIGMTVHAQRLHHQQGGNDVGER